MDIHNIDSNKKEDERKQREVKETKVKLEKDDKEFLNLLK